MKLTWKYSTIKLTQIFPWNVKKFFVKYLAVLIDENLSWKYLTVHLASKISKTFVIIARLRHYVPLATLRHICISLIQPYLLYGIVAWGWAAQPIHIETKFLFSKNVPTAWCTLVTTNLILYPTFFLLVFFLSIFCTLNQLLFWFDLILDISNNLSPPNIANLFISKASIHSYKTRSPSRGDCFVKTSGVDKQIKSFSINGVKI